MITLPTLSHHIWSYSASGGPVQKWVQYLTYVTPYSNTPTRWIQELF